MTIDLDSERSIRISHGTLIGHNMYRASAQGYLRGEAVGELFEGYGSTMGEADLSAERAARDFILSE